MPGSFQRVRPSKRLNVHQVIVAVLIFVSIAWSLRGQQWRLQESALHIWIFDIGQGDAIFVETPDGKQMLIDGGPDNTVLSKLPSVMWPWDRTIDAVVVSHPDADHITGLVSVLDRYRVSHIYETGVRGGTAMIKELVRAIESEPAQHHLGRAGQSFEFDGVQIDILWPTQEAIVKEKDRNNTSIVMRLRYGKSTILLTGDAEASVEEQIAGIVGDIDALKVGHHGSKTSTSMDFLWKTKPEISLVSAGEENRYGHPHPIILTRLSQIGSEIWRTDIDGDILITSDGKRIQASPAFLPF